MERVMAELMAPDPTDEEIARGRVEGEPDSQHARVKALWRAVIEDAIWLSLKRAEGKRRVEVLQARAWLVEGAGKGMLEEFLPGVGGRRFLRRLIEKWEGR